MAKKYKSARWVRLKDDSWGLRIDGIAIEGEVVRAETRGGKVSCETLGEVLHTEQYDDDFVAPYTIARREEESVPEVKPEAKRGKYFGLALLLAFASCTGLCIAANGSETSSTTK